jgi:hypothetical protein
MRRRRSGELGCTELNAFLWVSIDRSSFRQQLHVYRLVGFPLTDRTEELDSMGHTPPFVEISIRPRAQHPERAVHFARLEGFFLRWKKEPLVDGGQGGPAASLLKDVVLSLRDNLKSLLFDCWRGSSLVSILRTKNYHDSSTIVP